MQPHAGANANLAVYQALLEPGDTILAMRLDHGGHLTHGSPASITSKIWRFVSYGVSAATDDPDKPGEIIDFDQVAEVARRERPEADRGRLHRLLPDHRPAARSGRSPTRSGPGSCSTPPTRPASSPAASIPHRWGWPTWSPSPPTRRCGVPGVGPSSARRSWPRRSTARSSPASRAAPSSTSSRPRRWPSPRRPAPSSATYAAQVVANAAALGRRPGRHRASGWCRAAPRTTRCWSTCAPSTPS